MDDAGINEHTTRSGGAKDAYSDTVNSSWMRGDVNRLQTGLVVDEERRFLLKAEPGRDLKCRHFIFAVKIQLSFDDDWPFGGGSG